jgi:hypothetical protein
MKQPEMSYQLQNTHFGVHRVSYVPWGVIFELRRAYGDDAMLWTLINDSSLIALVIDWRYTNDELKDDFERLLSELRPKQLPEPRQAGRSGRSKALGAVDKLNQLTAYRMHQEGLNLGDLSAEICIYTSKKGWQKAIAEAEERIAKMTERRFFG